ncbi:hypothetical protein HYS28_03080 [Candidatus Uhrbacteria bacterium]|nr:hypothetical protein [Candidatus Uhrbacteria bacterium]
MDAYHAAVARLSSLGNLELPWKHSSAQSLRDSLARLRELLARLEHPERRMRFIHVTGTSGKGSVTHLIHEMLLADGRKVGSYMSPHTTTLLERFRVGQKLLDPKRFVQATNIVLAAYEAHVREGKQPLTYFELTTCVALVAFVLEGVEWCVLEVGLGGRWDSTNVIPKKDVAVITTIDLDHTELLGNSLEAITREKAGIITGRCSVVSGEARPGIRAIIAREAKTHGADVQWIDAPNDDHRLHNALVATAAARAVGVPMAAIERAIARSTGLPCRCEVMQKKPLVIVDGAHNVAKMRTTCRMLGRAAKGKVHVVFGCKDGKDAKAMVAELAAIADVIHTTRYSTGRGAPKDPAALLRLVPKSTRGEMFLFSHDALRHALQSAKSGDTILVTGSLYLAGEVRTHWVSEKEILDARSSHGYRSHRV